MPTGFGRLKFIGFTVICFFFVSVITKFGEFKENFKRDFDELLREYRSAVPFAERGLNWLESATCFQVNRHGRLLLHEPTWSCYFFNFYSSSTFVINFGSQSLNPWPLHEDETCDLHMRLDEDRLEAVLPNQFLFAVIFPDPDGRQEMTHFI